MSNNCSCCGGNNCSDNNNVNANSPLSCFFSLPPKQFSLLSSLLGILFIDNLDLEQQNSLGNFIVGLGQTILTAAAQGSTLKSKSQQNDRVQQQLQLLKKQICLLEEEIDSNKG